MDWFGLGIMLQARDNASQSILRVNSSLTTLTDNLGRTSTVAQTEVEAIQNSLNSLQNNMLMGLGMQQFGQSMMNLSGAMLKPLIATGQQAIKTGSQFEQWRMTLKALYKDVDTANAKLQWGMNLAAKTPFEVGDVVQAVIGFKSIGVEADKSFKSANGEMRSFLEYMGDLGALRPDKGLQGVLWGVRNLFGGDGGRSLRQGLDIDFEQILGRDWGTTTDQIMKDLVEASEKLASGLMGELEGTWEQMISNLRDQSTRLFLAIADNGAFDSAKKTLKYLSDTIGGIDDDRLKKIGTNIAEAFSMVWKPIDFVIRKLVDFGAMIIRIAEENPTFVKFITVFLSLMGGVTALTGALLIFGGTFMIAVNGIKLFLVSLQGLRGSLLFVGTAIKGAMLSVAKFALIGGGLYALWKTDFGGIRSVLQNFMQDVYTSFSYSAEIADMGATEMMEALRKPDVSWLTYQLVKLRVFWRGLCDAWNDYTLSDENFQKLRELGLLPLLETILDIKMKAEAFFEGFKTGWKKVSDVVSVIVKGICNIVGSIIEFLFPVEEGVEGVSEAVGGINLTGWEKFGEITAYIVSLLGGLLVITKIIGIITWVGGAIAKVWGVVTSIISGIGTIIGGIGSALSFIGGIVTTILAVMGVVVSLPPAIVGAIVVAIATLIGVIIAFWDEIVEGAKWCWDKIVEGWNWLVDKVSSIFAPVGEFFSELWEGIKEVTANVWDSILEFFTPVINFFKGLGQVIFGIFQIAWNLVKGVVTTVVSTIVFIVGMMIEGIKFIVTPIIDFFKGVWDKIVSFVSWAYESVVSLWDQAVTFFTNLWNDIYDNIIKPIWDKILEVVQYVYDTAISIWSAITEFFSNLWQGICDIASSIWQGIQDIINSVVNVVMEIWQPIKEFFSGLWQGISDTVSEIWDSISEIITGVYDVVSEAWGKITGVFSDIWGNVKDTASTFFEWLGDKFGWVADLIDGVTGVFSNIGDGISSGVSNVIGGFKKMVGLNTGGYVKTEGVAMLHPNEVVVNDEITQRLRAFLTEREQESPLNPPVTPQSIQNINIQPIIGSEATPQEIQPIVNMEAIPQSVEKNVANNNEEIYNSISNATSYSNSRSVDRSSSETSTDNSITFSEGAIQVTLTNGNEADVNKLFKEISKRLQREQSLRSTLNYRPSLG